MRPNPAIRGERGVHRRLGYALTRLAAPTESGDIKNQFDAGQAMISDNRFLAQVSPR